MAVTSGPVKGVSTDFVSGAFEGRAPRLAGTGPEDGAVCSERILSTAAWRTSPVVFSYMSASKAAAEDVLTTYFEGVRVSERRQSVGCHGRGAA